MLEFKNKNTRIENNIYDADFVTHNGTFHADEVFASIVLMGISDKDDLKIHRTSEVPEGINAIVYDVGLGEFDHHQSGGNGSREDGIKYASFGLIWRRFGKEYLQKIGVEEIHIDDTWKKIEEAIVEDIDAGDNGQLEKVYDYHFDCMGVADIVNYFNSNWNEEENQDGKFIEAVNYMKILFEKVIQNIYAEVMAKAIIENKIEESTDRILVLEEHLPWKELVIESESLKAKELLYVIFPSNRGGYNVYAIPAKKGSFDVRKKFPSSWGGLRDEELQNASGVQTARFCHNGRFICSCNEFEDALLIAKKAIDNTEDDN